MYYAHKIMEIMESVIYRIAVLCLGASLDFLKGLFGSRQPVSIHYWQVIWKMKGSPSSSTSSELSICSTNTQ